MLIMLLSTAKRTLPHDSTFYFP